MSRIQKLEYEDASAEVQKVYEEIQEAFSMVPNLFKVAAHFPPLLAANWEKVKAVMGAGTLSKKTKETIAVLVSKDNSCTYCVAAHTGSLKAAGITDEEIKQINEDVEKADFAPEELAIIGFVRRANSDPTKISDTEFENVRKVGASDAEIVEALGVMELFTGFNKFLDSLDVDLD